MTDYSKNVRDAYKRKWTVTQVCRKYGYEYPDVSASYAIQREIDKDKRIKPREAKRIHALLRGRTND